MITAMQDNLNLYEYAVIRYVPDVEREEFVNVGLIMMSKRHRWIRVVIKVDEDRVRALFKDADLDLLNHQLRAFEVIASGKRPQDSTVPAVWLVDLPVEERFRWLTAVRSACIQSSRPHAGKSPDLDATLQTLSAKYL